MKKRIFLSALIICLTFMALPLQASAQSIRADNSGDIARYFTIYELEAQAELYSITVEELININELLSSAIAEYNVMQMSRMYDPHAPTTIQISDNLYAVFEVTYVIEPALARSLWRITWTPTLELRNIFGMTVVTLRSTGVFETNFSTQIRAIDAFGGHSGAVWSITHGTPAMSTTNGFSAWVRNSFSGSFSIGIDPISLQIQSFTYNNTIDATANGTLTSTWR